MTALGGVLISLLAVVAFGAVVPVLPTGAAVSAAAAYMFHEHALAVPLVVVAGAVGAYAGDIVVFGACRWGGERLARRLHWLRGRQSLNGLAERLRESEVAVLLVSRLMPGGRVPVLLAAVMLGMDWRRFVVANVPACLLWSAMYASIGMLGGSVFPEQWQGVLAAVVLVVIVTQAVALVNRRRAASPGHRQPSPEPEPRRP